MVIKRKEREIGVTGREVSTRSSEHEKCIQGSDHMCSLSSVITMPNLSAELNLSSAFSRRLRFRLSTESHMLLQSSDIYDSAACVNGGMGLINLSYG